MKRVLTLASFTLIGSMAVAQTSTTTAAVAAPATTSAPTETSISAPFRLKAPTFGPMKLKVGLKSVNTSARAGEYDDAKGKRMKQKYEYSIGAVHTTGWGGFVQAVTSGTTYADSQKSTLSGGDPSITLLHPDFYKGESVTVSGQARRYFPVSDRSVNRNQRQYAYYLTEVVKLPARFTLSNVTTPRYFDQDLYKVGDTNWYVEDTTSLTRSMNDWFSYGVSQWTQVEWHEQAATGTSVDAGLFGKFSFFGGLSFQPALWFPVAVRNNVYDAAPNVSLRSARAEITAQLSL